MKLTYELDSTEELLKKRGLDSHGRAQKMLTSEIYRQSQPYTPFQQGVLAHGPANEVADDYIVYNTPYAHYQWKGEVMAGKAPKHYTGKPINHHGAPKRGKEWTRRMWADKKSVILDKIAKEAGGTAEL
jgi:Minor capsid.